MSLRLMVPAPGMETWMSPGFMSSGQGPYQSAVITIFISPLACGMDEPLVVVVASIL